MFQLALKSARRVPAAGSRVPTRQSLLAASLAKLTDFDTTAEAAVTEPAQRRNCRKLNSLPHGIRPQRGTIRPFLAYAALS